jgi:hypothetical protein
VGPAGALLDSPVLPDWGHALVTPERREICVPASAFPRLRRLGISTQRAWELYQRHLTGREKRQLIMDTIRSTYEIISDLFEFRRRP